VQPQGQTDSFFKIATLCWWLFRFGADIEIASPGLRRATGLTDRQLQELVATAADYGYVAMGSGRLSLSKAGRELGGTLHTEVKELRSSERKPFRSPLDYVPTIDSLIA
jgi:hypothetical protein